MVDQERVCPPQCGYGLLGLCCTACLSGPCRRSPFDDEKGGRFCGEDGDWMVARNILQRVAGESLQAMAAFRNAVERVSEPANTRDASLHEGMKRLLSPFIRGSNALLERMYPGRAFPCLQALGFPAASWSATLLDAFAVESRAVRGADAQLADALRLSVMALAAEILSREPVGPAPEEIDFLLPETPSPLLLLVSDEGCLQDDGREDLLKEIETACGEAFVICKLRNIVQLPAIGRKMYDRWGIPASMSGSVAVVASSSMIRGLGALALGFSLVSVPGFPIHGSARVENYLTKHLKKTFGNAYLSVIHKENLFEQILGSLKP
jgi:hypothetical protein